MVHNKRMLHTNTYHATDRHGHHNHCDIHAVFNGKVRCTIVEYTIAFLNSDWQYFRWRGINQYTILTKLLIIGISETNFYITKFHISYHI